MHTLWPLLVLAPAGCALSPPYVPDPQPLEPGRLPAPDVALSIARLGPCTDSPERSVLCVR